MKVSCVAMVGRYSTICIAPCQWVWCCMYWAEFIGGAHTRSHSACCHVVGIEFMLSWFRCPRMYWLKVITIHGRIWLRCWAK